MKTSTLWVIRIALTVQFLAILAVPALVASAESPRGMWMAQWRRPQGTDLQAERTIGVLRLRDGKLSFVEQIGQTDWMVDLVDVKRVFAVPSSTWLGASSSIVIESVAGDEFVIAIMDANLLPGSAKKVLATIERAIESMSSNVR